MKLYKVVRVQDKKRVSAVVPEPLQYVYFDFDEGHHEVPEGLVWGYLHTAARWAVSMAVRYPQHTFEVWEASTIEVPTFVMSVYDLHSFEKPTLSKFPYDKVKRFFLRDSGKIHVDADNVKSWIFGPTLASSKPAPLGSLLGKKIVTKTPIFGVLGNIKEEVEVFSLDLVGGFEEPFSIKEGHLDEKIFSLIASGVFFADLKQRYQAPEEQA